LEARLRAFKERLAENELATLALPREIRVSANPSVEFSGTP
jgi:hypothetical protein